MGIEWTGSLPDVSEPLDFTDLLAEAAELVYGSVMQNFDAGGRPATWAAKKDGSRSFLTKTGALRGSIQTRSDAESFAVWTSKGQIPYAFAHQFGYAARNLPARPYMIFQEEDKKRLQEMFKDRILYLFQTKRKPVGSQS